MASAIRQSRRIAPSLTQPSKVLRQVPVSGGLWSEGRGDGVTGVALAARLLLVTPMARTGWAAREVPGSSLMSPVLSVQPPSEPRGHLSMHVALQRLCRARGRSGVDGIVARSADHEGLPPFGCHDRRPCWLVGSGLTEPREFGDMVNHHGADVLTQLAPAPHEPVDDLFAGIGHPNRSTINDDRALVPCEGYPAEPCYQILLAVAVNPSFEARA